MTTPGEGNVIGATRRPDGTWRKERRVKTGYVPPDEAEKYKSQTKKFFSQADKPTVTAATASISKNQKKHERRKQKKLEEQQGNTSKPPPQPQVKPKEAAPPSEKIAQLSLNPDCDMHVADRLKKIKALKKKLKQIEELEEKLSKGETLEQLQMEKIDKKSEFEAELAAIS